MFVSEVRTPHLDGRQAGIAGASYDAPQQDAAEAKVSYSKADDAVEASTSPGKSQMLHKEFGG